MKKIDLGQAIGILANLGVIAGIVFLAYEMQQNTAEIRASTLHGMTSMGSDYLIETSLDPEFNRLTRKAGEEPENLDEFELRQIRRIQRSQWQRYQAAYRHWERGSLSDNEWETYRRFICTQPGIFGTDLQAKFWLEDRGFITDDFAAYVEECNPGIPPIEE
jgi:hypothetical protein